ncbi:nuclear transport factor 2 family protein [Actinomycetospora straminea]|uniref:Nuclear transport factor 2 family protein n=1 Tax=Actinomycetospora straminea TaxID=663607 RepID=A0ABP9EDS6_9PSEU|nr:nuclear transport factor 2 family protein [Actinomycetospora straminea]MDD7932104.1 nuclear transport factor 2 family protein [Actinomycetospora straminea]
MTATTTDGDRTRARILRYLEASGTNPDLAHEIFAKDAVLEFPQSGERFRGRETFLAWRRRYPAEVTFRLRRIVGQGDLWVAEAEVRYDGADPHFGVSILEFRDGLVVRETIYGGPPWEAPDWRAPYREARDR